MIGIIGGTGPEGMGLAARLTKAGQSVCLGSRDEARALEAAQRVAALPHMPGRVEVGGMTNAQTAMCSDTIIVALPYSALDSTLNPLRTAARGKLIISVVASIEFVQGRPRPLRMPSGSAAQQAAALLPDSRMTSAFHTLSAEKLARLDRRLDEDTIVCADARADRQVVMDLVACIDGLRPVNGGRLEHSCYPEQFVGMLAVLNRIHHAQAGVRITDMYAEGADRGQDDERG